MTSHGREQKHRNIDLDAFAERALAVAERSGCTPARARGLRLATSGLSYRVAGRTVGMSGSGVAYWIARFGLRTLHDFRAANRPDVQEREVRGARSRNSKTSMDASPKTHRR